MHVRVAMMMILAGLGAAASGCGNVESNDDGEVDVSGSWDGQWQETYYTGGITFTLEQDGEDVWGTAVLTDSGCGSGGDISGTVDGDSVSGSVSISAESTFDFDATVDEDYMEGTFTIDGGVDCDGTAGTFDASR